MGYKLKTNSGAKKRFKMRKSGRVAHKKAGVRHNAGSKNRKRKLRLRGQDGLKLRDEKKVKEMFPYSR